MADLRTKRQKLEAVLAPGSGATDGERDNARSLLETMPASAPRTKAGTVLGRDAILAQESKTPQPGVRVRGSDGVWVKYDADDVDWEKVDSMRLPWREDGDPTVRYGHRRAPRL